VTKLLSMSTDSRNSWPLPGTPPPAAPSAPGESVRVEAALQSAPLFFTGLRVGPDRRFRVLGPGGIGPDQDASTAGTWRVDEVTIDGSVVESVVAALEAEARARDDRSALVVHGDFGAGSRVSIAATNVGEAPAYFYATWELEDVQ
jgi:hypothetical protein